MTCCHTFNKLSYNNAVFTRNSSEFFNQGDTEVVSYETDALSEVRPDEAIGRFLGLTSSRFWEKCRFECELWIGCGPCLEP